MKLLLTLCISLLLSFQTVAQNKNQLFTNVSYAFFGTGDLSGSAIGIDYHRSLWNRFGLHLGYSKATGKGDNTLDFIGELNRPTITNLIFDGSGNQVSNLANYDTYLLGLDYKIVNRQKHLFLVSTGLNYKQIQYNYLGGFLAENINAQGIAESVTIQNTHLLAEKETGIYGGLDYLYVLDNALSLGLHLVIENSSNIVSKTGISLGFSF